MIRRGVVAAVVAVALAINSFSFVSADYAQKESLTEQREVIIGQKENYETVYLSDLDWLEATHGDADKNKSVQKDKPFTPGNNGKSTLISLLMPDGKVHDFSKGIGTVADYPSTISYGIANKGFSKFSSYVGIDQSANSKRSDHAFVEKVEIEIDGNIVYSSLEKHAQGLRIDTQADFITVNVPENAKTLTLKSYAGEHTWGDEVVFADAKLERKTYNLEEITPELLNKGMPGAVYLSDLDWLEATHGDADKNKSVQKDKPFTPGNNNKADAIRLTLNNKEVTFVKGLGTVADNPSTIKYDISNAGVTRFLTYVGIDHNANAFDPDYANVSKVEVVVDGNILYSSLARYPNGIAYDTEAILLDLKIPKNAKTLELKSYAGEHTWGDEIVFAGALFIANGRFDQKNEVIGTAEKRRKISNTHPLLMMPLYANGEDYLQGKYTFWGGDTLSAKWTNIDDDLKPYTVIQLHPDDLPKRDGAARDFYEYMLREAVNYINPKTGKSEPIPIILTVYTAGNMPYYTSAHWLTIDWIDAMYRKYPNLQGIFSTENYWIWADDIERKAAEYLKVSAKNGGYFIWAEQNNGAAIEKAFGKNGKPEFRKAVEQYNDNFIFMFKNTPAAEGNDAPTTSYMKGIWLANYSHQWGGLMDTWKWYETGKWRLFSPGNIGKSQGNRQWLTEPEAMLGEEALSIYLNGGAVYNFEHPSYTYGVKNEESLLFKEVIKNFFRYAIAHPGPSKEDIINSTKVLLHGDFSNAGNGNFFVGLNTEKAQTPLYTTGRYAVIPAVPSSLSVDALKKDTDTKNILVKNLKSAEFNQLEKKQEFFNSYYAEAYKGDIFAQQVGHSWFLYNYHVNDNVKQSGQLSILGHDLNLTIEPHTWLAISGSDNELTLSLNNFRTNKDDLWKGAGTADQAKVLPQLSKKDAIRWIEDNYIQDPKLGDKRNTIIEISQVEKLPRVTVVDATTDSYDTPQVEFAAEEKLATISLVNNGHLKIKIEF